MKKIQRKNCLPMLTPKVLFFFGGGADSIELLSKSTPMIYFIFHYSKVPSFANYKNLAASP